MTDLPEFTNKVGLERNIVKLPETEEDWKSWKDFWAFVKPWHHGFGYFAIPVSGHTHHDSSATVMYVSPPPAPDGSRPKVAPSDRTVDTHSHDFDQYTIFISAGGEGSPGRIILGDKEYEVEPNSVIFFPKGVPHAVISSPSNNKMTISFMNTPVYY